MGNTLKGLSQVEADALLAKFGPNVLPETPPPSDIQILLSQIKSPLVYILIFAGVVTFFLRDYSDTTIILLAVLINTMLGFFQERRAGRALAALKNMLRPEALVIREGERLKIPVENLVPGDIVVLPQGEKVPADGEIIEASRLYVEEAMLTGESAPVSKELTDKIYMGTIVTAGFGMMRVELTGNKTKLGDIALSVQGAGEDTPLRKQLKALSRQLSLLIVAMIVFVFVLGLVRGRDFYEIFTTSVALAVSAIPEGLLVALTVILAVGMQRILKAKGLVRNLLSAETLGGVTTICVDKTGTLTEGHMKLVSLAGERPLMAKQAVLSNDRDDPLTIAAWEWGVRELRDVDVKGEKIDDYIDKHARLDTIPFSSHDRFSATLHKWRDGKNMMFVNGAPDFVLEWCKLNRSEKDDWTNVINKMTSKGMRVMGMATRMLPARKTKISKELANEDLSWIGLMGFSDPVRSGVSDSLSLARKAGIRTIIITGDYPQTAKNVASQLGIEIQNDKIVLGEELSKMGADELSTILADRSPILFARTTPEQKLKIVEALKKNGEVVAMTGDGVNDAPALSQADIGIAVAEATDVSKESADLVLLDSNFKTIIASVEEGRGIFDNVRKVLLYLLSGAFSEISAVCLAILFALPLPVTATQILWINLVSDSFPSLALTLDPKRPSAMSEPPRDPRQPLVTRWMVLLIAFVSVFSGASALFLFNMVISSTGDLTLARSVAFAALGVNSLVYVFSLRSLKASIFKSNPFKNRWLLAGVFGGFVLQVVPFVFSQTQSFFGVSAIPAIYWLYIMVLTLLMLVLIELSKLLIK